MKYRGSVSIYTLENKGPLQVGDVFVTNTRIRLIYDGEAWSYDRDLKVHK